jgi:hypothetical protein
VRLGSASEGDHTRDVAAGRETRHCKLHTGKRVSHPSDCLHEDHMNFRVYALTTDSEDIFYPPLHEKLLIIVPTNFPKGTAPGAVQRYRRIETLQRLSLKAEPVVSNSPEGTVVGSSVR